MATIPASENEFPQLLLVEAAAPAAPATGLIVAYAKAGGVFAWKDDAGNEHIVGEGDLAAHLADAADAHDASAISVADAGGNFTATDVEAALAELFAAIAGGGAPTTAEYVTYAANGSLSAERVVTAPSSGGQIPQVVRKSADETVNNSNTLQNDDHLLYALAASEEIGFECDIWYESGATPDFKAGWTVPAGATIKYSTTGFDVSGTSHNDSNVVQTSGSSFDYAGSATPQRHCRQKGIVTNGANAGNLQLQWAQNTANASDTKVLKNSVLRVWKLA